LVNRTYTNHLRQDVHSSGRLRKFFVSDTDIESVI
ncbi:unnamed protein product, partial [Allacma fusca]